MATGFSTQSELWPSACMVELPSKPHSGSCSSVGNESNSLICVLPRRFGVGVYPSSQIYSSLYFVIEISHALMMRRWETETCRSPTRLPGHHRPLLNKHLMCQSAGSRNAQSISVLVTTHERVGHSMNEMRTNTGETTNEYEFESRARQDLPIPCRGPLGSRWTPPRGDQAHC